MRVSVIVPVYNTAKYLRQCLQSLREQTLKDIEIICVNDGSTDDSRQIIDEVTAADNRFIHIVRTLHVLPCLKICWENFLTIRFFRHKIIRRYSAYIPAYGLLFTENHSWKRMIYGSRRHQGRPIRILPLHLK